MAKKDFAFEYKHMQIIKHALRHYLQREGASYQDLVSEIALLNRVENYIKEQFPFIRK
ncbi:hypothetical protein [Rummeliibacillus sp. POC4]|uniref:hypothetical protein n=1 Tax=Rummeliibacillus sp. POC4 TaxID=2305899 RepID=UPI0018F318BD|nr:hypothetical protein [Rummeliibacillus sp. POC4]